MDANAAGETFRERFEDSHGRLPAAAGDIQLSDRQAIAPAGPRPEAASATELVEPPFILGLGGDGFLVGLAYAVSVAVGALGIIAGLIHLAAAAEHGMTAGDWLTVALRIIAGLAIATALAAAGQILSAVQRNRAELRALHGAVAAQAERFDVLARQAPDPMSLRRLEDRLDRLGEMLDEVARNSLLDEAARTEKRRHVVTQQREAMIELIRKEMADGQWDRARVSLDRFRAGFTTAGDADQANRLDEEFTRRRRQAEAEDVAATREQCDELMSVSAWDRASDAATGLVAKHPDSTAAKALLARVDRGRKVAGEQQRQALHAQIQRHTSRREWKEAVASANRLIELFPTSIEAEAIRAQMETLTSNAEIQHRQAMEASIKDLVKRQRFEEAVALAEELMSKYPNSPQAGVLRETIGQLREKAEQAAREARKRRAQW